MKLYLVRHGESLSSEVDPNQALSETGKKETEAVAAHLKPSNLEIDEIIHSVKLRAKQTAEILGNALAPDVTLIEKEGLKPMDPIEPILEEIQTYDRNVMLVGHLPFMENLLAALLQQKAPVTFCGSCVVCLEKEGKSWKYVWHSTPHSTKT